MGEGGSHGLAQASPLGRVRGRSMTSSAHTRGGRRARGAGGLQAARRSGRGGARSERAGGLGASRARRQGDEKGGRECDGRGRAGIIRAKARRAHVIADDRTGACARTKANGAR